MLCLLLRMRMSLFFHRYCLEKFNQKSLEMTWWFVLSFLLQLVSVFFLFVMNLLVQRDLQSSVTLCLLSSFPPVLINHASVICCLRVFTTLIVLSQKKKHNLLGSSMVLESYIKGGYSLKALLFLLRIFQDRLHSENSSVTIICIKGNGGFGFFQSLDHLKPTRSKDMEFYISVRSYF